MGLDDASPCPEANGIGFPSRAGPARSDLCNSLWIGDRLGPLERACLRSFTTRGVEYHLWCYRAPDGVPEGVTVRNAAEILPLNAIIRHRSGSVALFANRFRYELQRRGIGLWVDTDVYLLRPLPSLTDAVFAWETPGRLGNAVLRLPADSPLIESLLAVFAEDQVPPWLPLRARAAASWRLWRRGKTGLPDMPWGAAGPSALTYLVGAAGGLDRALPSDMFYPAPWSKAHWIADPALGLDDVAGDRTIAVHLWNELIKGFKDRPARRGSFLHQLQMEGA